MKYKRILLKLSGGGLSGKTGFGFDKDAINHITKEVIKARNIGVEIAIMVGGGNIFRGKTAQQWNLDRVEADNIGMMATVVNSLLLRGALCSQSTNEVRVMSAISMDSVCEPYIRLRAINHLTKGYIVIFAGGIGQPFLTTDYPSVQRALEINADVVLMAKNGAAGVYNKDPNIYQDAKRYKAITYEEAINKNLEIIDQAGFILARDFNLSLHVFDFQTENSVKDICEGKDVGTYISNNTPIEWY
ncbi:MAG: UMP kinase [Clostridia bacterium]|jgi:uridylate kinase|nr:UMP kinase [Clostridia bacterium]